MNLHVIVKFARFWMIIAEKRFVPYNMHMSEKPLPANRVPGREQPPTPEIAEKYTFNEVHIGYVQPFPDADQKIALYFQMYAGTVDPSARISFYPTKAPEEAFSSNHALTLEATYKRRDTTATDTERGNFGHSIVVDGDAETELCAGYTSYRAVEEKLRDTHPEQIDQLQTMAEYIQTVDLGKFNDTGVEPPTLTQLLSAADLGHFAHPKLREQFGIQETNQAEALQEGYALFRYVIESGQDPFSTIDLEVSAQDSDDLATLKQTFTQYLAVEAFQKEHDQEAMRQLQENRPEVVKLPSGVQVGWFDVTDAELIAARGGMGWAYRRAGVSGHTPDVLVLNGLAYDAQGNTIQKVMVGVNTRNRHAAAKGIDLAQLARELNNREYTDGIGAEMVRDGNQFGGHMDNEMQVMSLVGSPTETGTALNPEDIHAMVEECLRVPRYTDEQLLAIAHEIGRNGAWVELVPAAYPHQNLREKAIVSCQKSKDAAPHPDHVCTTCKHVIRESELAVSIQDGEVTEATVKSKRVLRQEATDTMLRYVSEHSPRAALFEIARENLDMRDFEGEDAVEVLLPLLEGIAKSDQAIRYIYDANNSQFNSPDSALLDWERISSVRTSVTRYQTKDSLQFKIDTDVQAMLFAEIGGSADIDVQMRYVYALEAIVTSKEYRMSHQEGAEAYDHVLHDLVHIGLNRPHRLQRELDIPYLWDDSVQNHVKELLGRLDMSASQKEALVRYIKTEQLRGNEQFADEAMDMLGLDDEAIEIGLLAPLEIEVTDRGLPTKHLAVVMGRPDNQGVPIVDLMRQGVGATDMVLHKYGRLTNEEKNAATVQILNAVTQLVAEAASVAGEGKHTKVMVTLQGMQRIAMQLGRHIGELQQEFPNVEVEVWDYDGAGYSQMPSYEDNILYLK